MSTAHLKIDLTALAENWHALNALSACPAAAVIKANGYGLGADRVAKTLADAGVRHFFVAAAEEGVIVRRALGSGPAISILSGHMQGDTPLIDTHDLTPMLNSAEQLRRHLDALPDRGFGVQLDTGMNRLGMEPADWTGLRAQILARPPALVMSHLACADEPDHAMNARQLQAFAEMTDGIDAPRSLAATGGILLGPDYHFDLTRPGIGLYGGLPFAAARAVVTLDLPVIQTRDLQPGETVGYGNTWTAPRACRIATVAAGYADGLIRAMGAGGVRLFAGEQPCPVVGRVSMDLITADITDLGHAPEALTILGRNQTVDDLADTAGTIGYEILTSLGGRYRREYLT